MIKRNITFTSPSDNTNSIIQRTVSQLFMLRNRDFIRLSVLIFYRDKIWCYSFQFLIESIGIGCKIIYHLYSLFCLFSFFSLCLQPPVTP